MCVEGNVVVQGSRSCLLRGEYLVAFVTVRTALIKTVSR